MVFSVCGVFDVQAPYCTGCGDLPEETSLLCLVVSDQLFHHFSQYQFSLPVPQTYISPLQAPLVAVDSVYYGRLVLTPLNIVLYNVFGKGGPDLYGIIMVVY